jgi:hypothetical protein
MVTQHQLAKAKLRALVQGVQVWTLEPGRRYVTPSGSNGGTAYEVAVQSIEPGDITCTCPGGMKRGICKHIGAVLVRLQVEGEVSQVNVNKQVEARVNDLYR